MSREILNNDNPSMKKDLATLTATVASMGSRLQDLAEIQNYRGPMENPNEPVLRELWNRIYTSLVDLTFKQGLSYYNNKPALLFQELQLCVIRADEAIEQYIRVRNVSPDPVRVAQERWAREQLLSK
jgi:hypothetical protein